MPEVLTLKKSNCKNCHKCIRFCPVKAIRFTATTSLEPVLFATKTVPEALQINILFVILIFDYFLYIFSGLIIYLNSLKTELSTFLNSNKFILNIL